MAILIPALEGEATGQRLANRDFPSWYVNPTVWRAPVPTPALMDFLQRVDTLFVPAVLLVSGLFFVTVYLRYHYTVDLMAGAVLAAVLIAAGHTMYRKLSEREDSIGA